MRKLLVSAVVAVSGFVFAAPAAAQYYPAPQPYGYGNAYNYGGVGALHARLNNVERQIVRLDRRDRIGEREADRLRREANRLERRLRNASYNGLNPREANDINVRIGRLEQRVRYAMSYGWNRYGRQYGWNSYSDRDHDGRNDRYEDDRGRDHDGRWDR